MFKQTSFDIAFSKLNSNYMHDQTKQSMFYFYQIYFKTKVN